MWISFQSIELKVEVKETCLKVASIYTCIDIDTLIEKALIEGEVTN